MISKEEWLKRIEEYKQSGKSLLSWCREKGIPPSTFKYHTDRKKKNKTSKFIELKPALHNIKLTCKNFTLELHPTL